VSFSSIVPLILKFFQPGLGVVVMYPYVADSGFISTGPKVPIPRAAMGIFLRLFLKKIHYPPDSFLRAGSGELGERAYVIGTGSYCTNELRSASFNAAKILVPSTLSI
jgi:hypothetical protein